MSNWLSEKNDRGEAKQQKPHIKKDPMYQLLREGKIEEFNKLKAKGKTCDLTFCDFRGLELSGLDASGLDFSGCYFRLTDLRGIDFSKSCLEGASIHEAKISGVYFPKELSSDEITMSLIRGTRLRYGC
ncbi:MAG: pentapeptide repeat-containing protein [Gammaproteobacteria bacterium]|nr:pentapeptide repeat-containing protein [Gammaproteobacteria bacterium]MDH5727796.1 pentapeptide repeat-containing protein [Gammaproteobacteria bacterium]